ncbi:fluoroquinolone transport system permease protein [Paenibacillus uliginis N3/975]|uniref:Fluoroquinolone transport system permease protein n=1 Tax=Paenibacillus uliginis N3/975 TaxID=1313296 RepID=A0A1X7HN15_9BACL|nr:hypothetical protein [Paenibacillus uliginis]SMF89731.1 fluoroquinolone transport system permease protein [Paenibacillus uliginis N3/975]
MNRAVQMLRRDIKQVGRDPMLVFITVAPLLLVLALKYGVPIITSLLLSADFQLSAHYGILYGASILLIPLVVGVMAGLMMLDERDEQLIAYYAITPITQQGYFLHRLTLPTLLSGIYIVLAFLMVDYSSWNPIQYGFALPMLLIEGPIMALLLVSFASNKVEGLALSKIGGLLVFVPVLSYFLPEPWRWGSAVVPTFWVAQLFTQPSSMPWNEPKLIIAGFTGLVVHLVWLRILFRRYLRRIA